MLFKCPQACRLSVMHVSSHILHLRALGMPMDDVIYCLAQSPLLFTWAPPCEPPPRLTQFLQCVLK